MVQSLNIQSPAVALSTPKFVDRSIFPDGLKTSGQHPPLSNEVYPYSTFPKHITGATVWKPEDYVTNPERWIHRFSNDEISEISLATDRFIQSMVPLTGITRDAFPLPKLSASIAVMRREMLDGKGFTLYKGIPVSDWGILKSAVAYMGLGTHIGYPISQNGRGHILGHVKDLGEDSTRLDKVRIYRTNARQLFHMDKSDVVGLLCLATAEEGGESALSSVHYVWNILQAERPDVAELLAKPAWYFDRKGEVSQGEDPFILSPVLYLETLDPANPDREQRVYCKYNPDYVSSLDRFSDAGIIPPLSAAQVEAIQVFEDAFDRVKLRMILEVGDIQFVANSHTLHARTAYRDYEPESGMPKRHLMRLWLSTPQHEGGWRLPFRDAEEKKRGGIQVDDTAPVARLDAD